MSEIQVDFRGREQIKAWYALVVFPGREIKIRDRLIKLVQNNESLQNQIFRIIVPAIKTTNSKGKIKEELIYTQYVYIEMILNDDTYHAVKIDGVRHILGQPTPLTEEETKDLFLSIGEDYKSISDSKE